LLVRSHPEFGFRDAGGKRRQSRPLSSTISCRFESPVELGIISKEMGGDVVRESNFIDRIRVKNV